MNFKHKARKRYHTKPSMDIKNKALKNDHIQFNSIYFVFDRSKGVVNPQDIEHVNI